MMLQPEAGQKAVDCQGIGAPAQTVSNRRTEGGDKKNEAAGPRKQGRPLAIWRRTDNSSHPDRQQGSLAHEATGEDRRHE